MIDDIVTDEDGALHLGGVLTEEDVKAILDAVTGELRKIAGLARRDREILYLIDPDFHFERGTHVHGKQLLVGIDDTVLKIYVIGEDDEMIIREARNEIIREAFPERLRHMEQEGITCIKAEVDIVRLEVAEIEIKDHNRR